MSGTFTTLAPASFTASTTSRRKEYSVRHPSSAENSTSGVIERASLTAAADCSTHSRAEMLSLYLRWMAEVARKTCRRGVRAAPSRARPAAVMSASLARHSAATVVEPISLPMVRTDSNSPGEAIGKPASMMSTPRRSSCRARRSFSAGCMLQPGDCSPSRRVVSNTVTRDVAGSSLLIQIPPKTKTPEVSLGGPCRSRSPGR